jgi:hypothetical protein
MITDNDELHLKSVAIFFGFILFLLLFISMNMSSKFFSKLIRINEYLSNYLNNVIYKYLVYVRVRLLQIKKLIILMLNNVDIIL